MRRCRVLRRVLPPVPGVPRDGRLAGASSLSNGVSVTWCYPCTFVHTFAVLVLVLSLAITSGVSGTLLTRASQGFKRWKFGAGAVLTYGLATVLLAWLVQQMPVGAVYAIWTGTASVVLLVVDRLLFSVDIQPLQLVGIFAVLSGVVLLSIGAAQ